MIDDKTEELNKVMEFAKIENQQRQAAQAIPNQAQAIQNQGYYGGYPNSLNQPPTLSAEQTIRTQILQVALQHSGQSAPAGEIISRANAYYQFIMGTAPKSVE